MPGVGIDDFQADFDKYLKGVVMNLRRGRKINKIPLGSMKWKGKALKKKVETGMNVAYTAGVDGGPIPPSGKSGYAEIVASRRFHYGSASVTDGVLANASTTEGSAVTVIESQLRSLEYVAKKSDNFFMSRNGTGQVATLGSTVSGSTITVSDARALLRGKEYEIRDAADPTIIHATFRVQSVARAMSAGVATVTVETAVPAAGQATGDLVIWGAGEFSAYGKELTGFDALIDDSLTTFQGLNCATYPEYTSIVIDGGGSVYNITPALLRQFQAMLKQESQEFDDKVGGLLFYTSVWDGVNIASMYDNTVRLTPDAKSVGFEGGLTWKSELGTITVLADPDVPYGKMFAIDRKKISLATLKEFSWRTEHGNSIFKRDDRNGRYTASCIEIKDLFIEERNTCGKFENLRVSPASAY